MQGGLRIVAILVALIVGGGLLWLAWRPSAAARPMLSGYIEGEPLYLASPVSGALTEVAVARGQRVETGAPLFVVDPRSLSAQRAEAAGQVTQAGAQIAAAGASQAQLEAAAKAARANAEEAAREAERASAVHRQNPGAIAQQDVDKAQAAAAQAQAQALAAEHQARAAAAQVGAAEGQRAQAEGALADATARLSQVAPRAPSPARVEDVYFQAGEWASANQPIVSLLPDARVRLRFFVGETSVARYRPGERVRFACDGCQGPLTAVIDYVSPRPEFTPPEIYSREDSQKLVFLVEAEPARPDLLTPGQPVQVAPLAASEPSPR
ncbi:MAG TPA: HlyD family efflux transporter periplasmic adaptor subunit [Caulobacteraceae bacterium]|nr:HlyD family efflux transporter periplasmic adaptor subunit [Caulobacteraceae bacterium]